MAIALAVALGVSAYAQQPQEKAVRRQQAERSSRLAELDAEERSRLRAAHEKALQDQQVRAAHERLQQARRDFRDLMGPALLRADPSVQPLLEKMRRRPRVDRD